MPSKVFPVSEANEGSRHATSTVVTYKGELLLLKFSGTTPQFRLPKLKNDSSICLKFTIKENSLLEQRKYFAARSIS